MKNRKQVSLIIIFILFLASTELRADRIYIVNSSGYNTAQPELIAAITNNGHTVNTGPSIPVGITTTCIDPVNGYDWICFFGNTDYTAMVPQMQGFIDNGGKVFYQYEVSCCTVSSQSAADVLTSLVGISITPNANSYIALASGGGWEATGQSCCATFIGNAYKALDGLPLANQLQATANINGSSPPISTALNFGFFFTTTDFASGADQGGIVGVGDVNMWYDGAEPTSVNPINTAVVDYFFPNTSSTCYIFPPGCMTIFNNSGTFAFDLGSDTTLCTGESLLLDVTTGGGTYLWQDNSVNSTFNVTLPGQYWVEVTGNCGVGSDTINVNFIALPTIDLGNDTSLCPGQNIMLDATTVGSTYLWQDLSVAPTYPVSIPGLYWVEVSTSCGVITDSINVTLGSGPDVDLGVDTLLCAGGTLLLDATTIGATYLWQDNSINPTFSVLQQGIYWSEVTVDNCTGSDTVFVDFEDCEVFVEMPNVFTPNGDGINDLFTPLSTIGIISMNTKIYNRWGNKVFETDEPLINWNANDVSDGVYFWIVQYTDVNGASKGLSGYVNKLE